MTVLAVGLLKVAVMVHITCGNTFAWWNRKVIEPLALHVSGAGAEDI